MNCINVENHSRCLFQSLDTSTVEQFLLKDAYLKYSFVQELIYQKLLKTFKAVNVICIFSDLRIQRDTRSWVNRQAYNFSHRVDYEYIVIISFPFLVFLGCHYSCSWQYAETISSADNSCIYGNLVSTLPTIITLI